MKAMRFHEYGEPDVLRLEDVDEPAPGPGEARVRVAATSFNPVDARHVRERKREHLPQEATANACVDVALNLAPVAPHQLAALAALIRPGGVVLSTTTPAPAGDGRGVRAVDVSLQATPASSPRS